MKNKNILPIAFAIASLGLSQVNAAEAGPYLGGQLGWGTVNQVDNEFDLAGRVFAGWLINKNFGIETGYTKFSSQWNIFPSTSLRSYAIDLVGKAILPLKYGFNVYGKLGVAYLNELLKVSGGHATRFGWVETFRYSVQEYKFYPTFSLGAGYDLTKHITADVSWNRIQKISSSGLNSTDFMGVGLSYNFG